MSASIVTDEILRAAKVEWLTVTAPDKLRAALEAVAPLIRKAAHEEAAKMLDTRAARFRANSMFPAYGLNSRADEAEAGAASIRALSEDRPK